MYIWDERAQAVSTKKPYARPPASKQAIAPKQILIPEPALTPHKIIVAPVALKQTPLNELSPQVSLMIVLPFTKTTVQGLMFQALIQLQEIYQATTATANTITIE